MITQPKLAQTNPLTINFNHRLSLLSGVNLCTLSDSVNMMADRATGVLNMLSCQFVDADKERLSDEIIYNTIEAAIKEVEDIKQVVRAYFLADKGDME